MPGLPKDMTSEELVQELEDIEAKISELEDRILTNELDFRELMREVRGDDTSTPESVEDRISDLEKRVEEDIEGIGKWKDYFESVTDKLEELEEEKDKIRRRLESIPEKRSSAGPEPARSQDAGDVRELRNDIADLRDRLEGLSQNQEYIFSELDDLKSGGSEVSDNRLREVLGGILDEREDEIKDYVDRKVSEEMPRETVSRDIRQEIDDIRSRQDVMSKKLEEQVAAMSRESGPEVPPEIQDRIERLRSRQESISDRLDKLNRKLESQSGGDVEGLRSELDSLKREIRRQRGSSPVILE